MLKKWSALTVVVGLSAVIAFSQAHRTPPDPQTMIAMRVNFLATFLNLSDTQKAGATAIFTNASTDSESIRTSLHANRQSLSDAVKKNDTAGIDALAATSGTLTGQMIAIESKADAAFYALLTADQQTKYTSMPHGGPGGPGGPGHGGGFGPRMHNPPGK